MRYNRRAVRVRFNGVARIALLCIAFSMVGCSTMPDRWFLDGKGQADLDAAHQMCSNHAAAAVNSRNIEQAGQLMGAGVATRNSGLPGLGLLLLGLEAGGVEHQYRQCMQAQGFRPA